MSIDGSQLEKYAELAVKTGVNIQKGQLLVINAPIIAKDLVLKVTKAAFAAGAGNVHVEWNDDDFSKVKYDHAPDEAFKEYPLWKAKGYEEMVENGAAIMSILAPNPELLKDVDPERVATAQRTAGEAMEKFRQYIQSDKVSWTIVAYPTKEWAEKVFPNVGEAEQVEKLWEAIMKATRVDTEDPVEAWRDHQANLQQKVEFLNGKKYKKLHYKAPGTALTIELPEKHIWVGGGGKSEKGIPFVPNMPTEEVFTTPKKDGVNGTVTSTKPLNYGGTIIDGFSFTFENGKIVDFSAKKGYETLKRLIETDEGSRYLGEVALVPHDSPISKTNLIFYNTLFDENASSHVAIGSAYAFCLEGGKTMSKKELSEHGANSSIVHVDFMIGSDQLDIDGEKADGTREPIFRQGNWAVQ
ncbi:aminopeptidase [Pueribacillus theae]|uniref:Aminopeptidase n=1 Tax=Pueribacillus theae TaxID=2171751 RepID=A0A2U1K0Z5_9BACI|nr:aminopeptidase [Pueribacillus theae]PWA10678.1 aminopeptidase [Pueribacillus theae]